VKEALTYSALFHAAFLVAGWHGLPRPAGAPKAYYALDLSLEAISGPARGPASLETWKPMTEPLPPEEHKDFLETPAKERTVVKAPPRPVSLEAPARVESLASTFSRAPSAAGPGAGAPGGAGRSSASFGDGLANFPHAFYAESVRRKIAANWQAGFWRENLLSRRAQISFILRRDGTIVKPYLAERSGDANFDLTCLRGVEMAAPFPPLPKGFAGNEIKILFDFETSP